MIFQLNRVRAIDVGWNAQHVEDSGIGAEVWETLEGASLVVFATHYEDDPVGYIDVPLNHAHRLAEVQTYCDATGATWIHLDTTNTLHWNHFVMNDPSI